MDRKPPHMPTGVSIGMLSDGEDKVGVLTLETLGEDIAIAINLQAVDVITRALNELGQELRKLLPEKGTSMSRHQFVEELEKPPITSATPREPICRCCFAAPRCCCGMLAESPFSPARVRS
ncbi:hypothetical protein [Mesorhizobium sp. B4-1-3]|uniref:hypothetical protein n=1 Tax=Mesorhizobium sp. B4-1-3 TaxID=2589889 RepID=UPI0015E2C742